MFDEVARSKEERKPENDIYEKIFGVCDRDDIYSDEFKLEVQAILEEVDFENNLQAVFRIESAEGSSWFQSVRLLKGIIKTGSANQFGEEVDVTVGVDEYNMSKWIVLNPTGENDRRRVQFSQQLKANDREFAFIRETGLGRDFVSWIK